MKFSCKLFLQLGACAAALTPAVILSSANQSAWSQSSRTVKIVVGTAAGGGADILTRMVAEQIRRSTGQTFVVENRPGASNAIATEAVLRAALDGTTVLIVSNSFIINPNLKRVNYDPLTSFEPV